MHLRVSASDIDAYRYYRESEDLSLADFLDRLRRVTPPTPSMLAGTALHKALENAEAASHSTLRADGYTFQVECQANIDLPDIRECKATRDYRIGDVDVTLVGKVDAILGKRIDDHKFTSRWDAERFLNSYQWRLYLEIFNADEFRWNVFEGRADRDDPQTYLVTSIQSLRTFRYPGMAEDVERELGLFVEFVQEHLPEKLQEKAA
jgi:hypothetical protein